MNVHPSARLKRRTFTVGAVTLAAGVAIQVATVLPAFANAANPDPDTQGSVVINADNTVTANLSGTWTWNGQSCAGRYAEGWAVDWWGVSSSKTPNPSFSLTNATEVTAVGTTTTGTISPAGAIPIKGDGFFHVAQYYAGQTINSPSTCTDFGSGKSGGSRGSWSASATYPSLAVVPPQVCVNIYDEHGKEGHPSKSATDLSPINDHDNSIQTNAFNPTAGAGYCVHLQGVQTIQSEIYLCNQGSPTSTLANGGSLSVPAAGLSSGNPLAPTAVAPNTYTVNAVAPSAYEFVACGQTGVTVTSTSNAHQSVIVPPNGAGDGKFYVTKIPSSQTIQGEIYICNNGVPTTQLVSGGTLSVPAANLSSGNPLAKTQVPAGTYTMNASAPEHYFFFACGQSGVTIPSGRTTASQSVTVPPGQAGDGRFYVVLGS